MQKFKEESVKINHILFIICEMNISVLENVFFNSLKAVFLLFSQLLYFKPPNKLESV